MFGLKFVAISSAAAFAAGVMFGGAVVYKAWDVAQMEAELRKIRKDQARTIQVQKLNEEIDLESMSVDKANEAIYEKLLQRLRDKPVEPVGKPSVSVKPGECPKCPSAECVSPGDLLELHKFR